MNRTHSKSTETAQCLFPKSVIVYSGISLIILLCLTGRMSTNAQEIPYLPDTYLEFMNKNKDISPAELNNLYPSDIFQDSIHSFDYNEVLYLEMANDLYNLTDDELFLLKKNGFVVSERIKLGSYYQQFETIYKNDLPVFISTDAILHAVHMSYDEILKQTEINHLIPTLINLLENAHQLIPALHAKYSSIEEMNPMLMDVDLYLSVSLTLLKGNTPVNYPKNKELLAEIITYIQQEKLKEHILFSENVERKIDYSQFKPRGHYTTDPQLVSYFKTMIWLGRTEFYLDNTDRINNKEVYSTIKRQTIGAALLHELFTKENTYGLYKEMEDIISFFVGKQDNVTLDKLGTLLKTSGNEDVSNLLHDENFEKFLVALRSDPYAKQNILSQILKVSNPDTTSSIPTSFLLFGQRFVVDSYVTHQVVWDRIMHNNKKICRLEPSTLDIMFALGNNASTQLLLPELHKWEYADNLAGLRYLIDQYPTAFWESSLYNMWLYTIQSLSPDPKHEALPDFMKTSAWGLEKINTQLCSWTELRHDNLLYAKPSYTSWGVCSHPEGYVEPNIAFYKRLKRMAQIAHDKFASVEFENSDYFTSYFNNMYAICDTLESIVKKELEGQELSDEECIFFDNVTHRGFTGSSTKPDGWYYNLIFGEQEVYEEDFVVADFHTVPTNCDGVMLGWVLHAGTGPTNMLIAVAPLANGDLCSFYGPVGSYHEYKTTEYLRLSDEDWKTSYQKISMRPDWVKNYMADANGMKHESPLKLFTTQDEYYKAFNTYWDPVVTINSNTSEPMPKLTISPSTVREYALITIDIPIDEVYTKTQLTIFDSNSRLVNRLIDDNLPAGNYIFKWDLLDSNGKKVPPGLYILNLTQPNQSVSAKMIVM